MGANRGGSPAPMQGWRPLQRRAVVADAPLNPSTAVEEGCGRGGGLKVPLPAGGRWRRTAREIGKRWRKKMDVGPTEINVKVNLLSELSTVCICS
jgi:hypothetical protein